MKGGSSFFPTLCCALFLWAATWMTPVAAEDNLPVAADGNVVFLPWRCGGYVALPESEHTRRSLEAAGRFGGNGLRLRGGTIFFRALRRGPGSLQIIIGRRGGDGGDDVNDIFTSGGVRAMSPLAMGASRDSGADFPTSDDDSSRTLRAMGEEKQQGVRPDVATITEGRNLIPPVNVGDGAESSSDSSSSSSSTFLDHLLSVLLTPPPHGLMMRQSPFLTDPAKLLLARTHGIRTIEDGTTSWLSRSRSGSVGEDEDEDGSISEREVMRTAAAAAVEAAKAARGDSSKGWELSRQLEVGDSSSRGGVSDDASSRLLEGGFVGNNYLDQRAPKVVHVPGVYSWRARDAADREEEGTGEEDGMFVRDVLLFPRRGEKQVLEEEEEEEGWEGEGVVGGILRCVKGWWRQVSTWVAGVGRSMLETVLEYQGSVEDCAVFALATAVPMTLLLLIVHVVAKCTYNDEEEEDGEEEEEDDDDDDEEGGQQHGARTVVVVTANTVGNEDVRTPLLDNRLYRGEDPTLNADDAMMSKLEATVVDYNPPNPADMTRGV